MNIEALHEKLGEATCPDCQTPAAGLRISTLPGRPSSISCRHCRFKFAGGLSERDLVARFFERFKVTA